MNVKNDRLKGLVEKYFDGASGIYNDVTSTEDSWNIPCVVGDILSKMHFNFNNALSVGVGTGYDIDVLKHLGGRKITAIDISERMLDLTRLKHPDVDLRHADIMHENFHEKKFDLIICMGVSEFVENFDSLIKKCYDLMLPGGTLAITYEPLILNYKPQEKTCELIHSSEDDKKYNCDGVNVYRVNLNDVVHICNFIGLKFIEHTLALAYIDECHIFYGIAILKRECTDA